MMFRVEHLAIAFAFVIAIWLAFAPPAKCNWCLSTFCANSADCPRGCHCSIPFGAATGECSG